MTSRREAVRSNAQYLTHVRPIDPEEICTYIDGTPHPAVVRQLLREEAPDLGLREREDGTFVPVGDEPVPPRAVREPGPIEAFPDRYAHRLEEFLVDRYGVDWHDGPTGDLLRSTIKRFKSQYLERDPVTYDDDVAAGYAIYHLPGYYAAIQYVIDDLAERDLLERHLRVLDIGAGVGGPALGLCSYLPEDSLLEYHAVEPSSATDVLEALLAETGPNVHATVHHDTVQAFDADAVAGEGFDLILVCNVCSELTDPEAVLRSALEWLTPDGSLVVMVPADKNASIELRHLERALEDECTIYSPTVRLWPGETPTDRGWSFDVRPDLAVPSFQRRLEDSAHAADSSSPEAGTEYPPGTFINVDVQFSYSIFRLDGTRRIDIELDEQRWAKMAAMETHVTNRVDLVAAKLSHSLSQSDEGERTNPLFKISDGSETVDHYAVLTHETSLNRPLLEAAYGDVLTFENALVLWNDDEGAYNLVLDDETIVDRLA